MRSGSGATGLCAIAVVAIATLLVGCGGNSADTKDDDGGGGSGGSSVTGGSAGTSGASGSGGSARPAKLGLYMFIRNPESSVPETAGRQCPTSTGVEWDIGVPIETNGTIVDVDSPNPTDFGRTLEDGMQGTTISCSVPASGAFQIDGSGTDPLIVKPDGLINFTLAGPAKPASGGEISLSVYTPKTFQLAHADGFPACIFSAVHEVHVGALWADFDCPALVSPTAPSVACHASGTIVAEYCEPR